MKDVHICPILMRTVIWIDGKCTEECDENDCPIRESISDKRTRIRIDTLNPPSV